MLSGKLALWETAAQEGLQFDAKDPEKMAMLMALVSGLEAKEHPRAELAQQGWKVYQWSKTGPQQKSLQKIKELSTLVTQDKVTHWV